MDNIKTSHSTAGQDHGHGEGGVPFFPDHFVKEMSVMALIFGVVLFLATLMPMPVGEPADALKTPPGIKPEWYFMTVYQMLKYVPKSAGLVFSFVIFPPVMMLFPFFYNWYTKYRYGRLILHTIVALGVLTAIFLAMLAYLGFE
ncbi:MAG: hypothetical protein C4534_03175 [Gaiellales bacterium]|nr:MAG: hypothetical protein C4534_03175 [Gaiellales bacterium]